MTADSMRVVPAGSKVHTLAPGCAPQYLDGRDPGGALPSQREGAARPRSDGDHGVPSAHRYLEQFIETLRLWTFAPALLDGCAVPGSVAVTLTL